VFTYDDNNLKTSNNKYQNNEKKIIFVGHDAWKNGARLLFIADSLNIHRRHTNSVTKALNAQKHFDEICNMQDYIFGLTKNSVYYELAKKYREEVREYLGIMG